MRATNEEILIGSSPLNSLAKRYMYAIENSIYFHFFNSCFMILDNSYTTQEHNLHSVSPRTLVPQTSPTHPTPTPLTHTFIPTHPLFLNFILCLGCPHSCHGKMT